MKSNKKTPYRSFGEELKKLRVTSGKSSAEVSGAVEIEENKLLSYEIGEQRPSEDILLLIIQHFGLKDEKAAELWGLAGYNDNWRSTEDKFFINDEQGKPKQVSVGIVEQDIKIVYTDMLQVMVNKYGVIMNFMQGSGLGSQPLAISRIGMSREHAISVLEVLKKTLEQADSPTALNSVTNPKRLSAPK